MIQALIGNSWRKIEILTVLIHGVKLIWRDKEIFKPFHHIRWISDNWYEKSRRVVA